MFLQTINVLNQSTMSGCKRTAAEANLPHGFNPQVCSMQR